MNDRRVGAIRTGHPFRHELPVAIAQTCSDVSVDATPRVNDDEMVADGGQSEDEPQIQRFASRYLMLAAARRVAEMNIVLSWREVPKGRSEDYLDCHHGDIPDTVAITIRSVSGSVAPDLGSAEKALPEERLGSDR